MNFLGGNLPSCYPNLACLSTHTELRKQYQYSGVVSGEHRGHGTLGSPTECTWQTIQDTSFCFLRQPLGPGLSSCFSVPPFCQKRVREEAATLSWIEWLNLGWEEMHNSSGFAMCPPPPPSEASSGETRWKQAYHELEERNGYDQICASDSITPAFF